MAEQSDREQAMVDAIVQHHMTLEDLASGEGAAVAARMRELLSDPDLVIDAITLDILEQLEFKSTAGDDFWDAVADLQDVSFSELHAMPFEERGIEWEVARQVRVAVAYRQALIESGAVARSMVAGLESADRQRSHVRGLNVQRFAERIDLKSQIKTARAERNG